MKNRYGALLAAIVASSLLAAGAAFAQEKQDGKTSRVPLPNTETYRGEKCVEPTDEMRRNHMKKILHQRDLTMHDGVRTQKHSLKNCVNCHANPNTGSVLGKDGFCASCHQYSAVTIDCFSCHTDKADKDAAAAPAPAPAAGRAVQATAANQDSRRNTR